jgi:hypothetical protein
MRVARLVVLVLLLARQASLLVAKHPLACQLANCMALSRRQARDGIGGLTGRSRRLQRQYSVDDLAI